MAENSADELARNVARNVIPFNAGEDLAKVYGKAESGVMSLLRQLGLLPSPQGYTPQLNEPLPIKDPMTGQMVYPQGYRGPR